MKSPKVRHLNQINHTFTIMPLEARRVLFCVVSKINSRKPIEGKRAFKITAKEYAAVCGIDPNSSYVQLKRGGEILFNESIKVDKELHEGFFERIKKYPSESILKTGFMKMRICESATYSPGSGEIEIVLTRAIEPYITQLDKNYTTQVLLSAARLNDQSSATLYQFLRKSIGQKKLEFIDIDFDKLRRELGVENSTAYAAYGEFNRTFMKPAAQKLINNTEFNRVTMTVIEKVNRKTKTVRIAYEYEPQTNAEINYFKGGSQ